MLSEVMGFLRLSEKILKIDFCYIITLVLY